MYDAFGYVSHQLNCHWEGTGSTAVAICWVAPWCCVRFYDFKTPEHECGGGIAKPTTSYEPPHPMSPKGEEFTF